MVTDFQELRVYSHAALCTIEEMAEGGDICTNRFVSRRDQFART